MNYAEWLTKVEEIAPGSTIEEEHGEIVIRTGLTVMATFDGRSSIPVDELEIVPVGAVL